MDGRLQVFTGTSHPQLAAGIMTELEAPLGRAIVGSWKNGETRVKLEENVRGSDVFVIQSMSDPVNHHLMEALLIIDALRRASAARITAVIPYFAYAKQEKKTSGREPISAKLVANLLATAGADRILTMDLHSPAIEGFFDIPVDHLRAAPILARYLNRQGLGDIAVVSPDAGGVARAEDLRGRTGGSLAIISKRHPGPDVSEALEMVGDVDGKPAIIVDDMISTGGTLALAAELLRDRGASLIYAAATHGIFAQDGLELIDQSPIDKVLVTDTLPLPANGPTDKVEVVTVAPLLAEAITRIHKDLSISALFT
ncbi:MAG: ribose-phosphate pyrophosphokinase [Thermomicrobiales bacterium]|nr:ribose-phosphate pyrophosphokinase [Thermomicrobiales bacterium]